VAIIRSLREDDLGSCAAIIDETPLWSRYGLTGDRLVGLLRPALAGGTDLLLAAEGEGGAAAGFAWWMRRGTFGRSPYLRLIGVSGSRRSGGIGAELLASSEAALKEGAREAFLLVSDFNEAARRFYRRQGWEEVGRLPDYVVEGVAEVIMWKRL
jgi:ribosomal-protein-alanine N-acetyltransferase